MTATMGDNILCIELDLKSSNPVVPIMLQWHRIHVAVVLSSVLEQE